MISIIISTINKSLFESVRNSIDSTIGCEYEIIIIDNPGSMGLCEAYNNGAALAKFDLLCFMHEDVSFKSGNWGKSVIEYFNSDSELGVIGIAGSYYKTRVPSHWFGSPATIAMNLVQNYTLSDRPPVHQFIKPFDEKYTEVVVIDGVWFCTRKETWQRFTFDQNTFRGFHCYDTDFCLSVFNHLKVAVVYDILLEHNSEGRYDQSWINDTLKLHDKWDEALPMKVKRYKGYNEKTEELRALSFFISRLFINNTSPSFIITLLRNYNYHHLLSRFSAQKINLKLIIYFISYAFDNTFNKHNTRNFNP